MKLSLPAGDAVFDFAQRRLEELRTSLAAAVVGQEALITDLLVAVFAGGHVLLEGLPGLGKTHLAKALAGSMGLEFARVQCTPDLMPADITGSEVLVRDESGKPHLDFRRGPVFAPLLLVDEINRATPKTQAALLEAMQERQVTYAGRRHLLPEPFCVLATQNPIELEGTYPLPEAQLDRFLFKLLVKLPDADALLAMLDVSLDREPADHMAQILDAAAVAKVIEAAREVLVAGPLKQAAVRLVLATQPSSGSASKLALEYFHYGASPRGLQALVRAARVRALFAGRVHVAEDDLYASALPALRHRVLLKVESEIRGVELDSVLREVIDEWRRSF